MEIRILRTTGSKDDHRNDLNEHHHSPRHIGRMGELVLHALAIYIYIYTHSYIYIVMYIYIYMSMYII